jgi:hypothetical protein
MGVLIAKALEVLLNSNSEPARLSAMLVDTFAKAQTTTETTNSDFLLVCRWDSQQEREAFLWAMGALKTWFDTEATNEPERVSDVRSRG